MSRFALLTTAGCWLLSSVLFAQTPDAEKPVIKLATTLGVLPGSTTKFLLRGLKLDDAKEIKCSDGKSSAKILSQGNADTMQMQDAKRVGDRKVEIELTVPADATVGELSLVVVTGKGESAPYMLLVGGEFPITEEKEANDGFRAAQPIAVPQIIAGQIHGDRNVDVFVFEGQAGQKIVCELLAARRGSNLDGLLSLYNERNVMLATNDDLSAETNDARLEVTLPAAGKYFLVLQDAHDLGGQAHPYRLTVRPN
ncbi:MAG TPA: PPC domain-containing protein [Pirellulaceae bacterium]|nr:PPC domain-containing protein [Pirellulaceae bacterium]